MPGHTFTDLIEKHVPFGKQGNKFYADFPYRIENRVCLQNRGYTDEAGDCSVVGLANQTRVSIFHLLRSQVKLSELKRHIEKDLNALRQEGKVRGIIAGGLAFPDAEGRFGPSKELYRALLRVLKQTGVVPDLSRIWGRKSKSVEGETSLLYDGATDTWFLHVHLNQMYAPSVMTRQGLKGTFATVYIAPGDRLITPEDGQEYRQCVEDSLGNGKNPEPELGVLGKLSGILAGVSGMWKKAD